MIKALAFGFLLYISACCPQEDVSLIETQNYLTRAGYICSIDEKTLNVNVYSKGVLSRVNVYKVPNQPRWEITFEGVTYTEGLHPINWFTIQEYKTYNLSSRR